MREMKDSGILWVGKLDKSYQLSRLKYFFNIMDEFRRPVTADKRNQNADSLYDYYGASGAIDKIDGYTIDDHVLLIGEDGANLKMRNLPLVYEVHGKAWINNHAHIIKPNSQILFRYAFYMLESTDINPYITGSAQPKFSQESLKNMYIIIPPLSEQCRIAAFLDTKCAEIDALTADIQEQIDTLEQYKRSVITEAVTKGLNSGAEMKDSGIEWIGRMPTNWGVMPNKYIMHKEKIICPVYHGEDILSLTMNGVIVRDLDAGGKMPKTFDGYQKVFKGNLLMCLFDIDVTPRCVGIINGDGLTSPAYSQFVLHGQATAGYYYYYYLMLDLTKELLHMAKNLRHSLTEEQLGMIAVPVPPVEEQLTIVTFLDAKCAEIDEIIKQKREQLSVIDEYKKSLIFEYVTGKKEVSND